MTNHTKLVREGRNEKLEEEEGGDALLILNRSPIHHQEVTRTCSSRSYFSSFFFFLYQLFSQVFFTTGMSDDLDNDRTEKGLRKKEEEPGVVSLYTLTGIVQILALED